MDRNSGTLPLLRRQVAVVVVDPALAVVIVAGLPLSPLLLLFILQCVLPKLGINIENNIETRKLQRRRT